MTRHLFWVRLAVGWPAILFCRNAAKVALNTTDDFAVADYFHWRQRERQITRWINGEGRR